MSSKEILPATQGPWSRELIKEVAMDIGKEVTAHIEIMYPAAIAATPGTFKTSVQNVVYNQIMAAIEVNDAGEILARLKERKRARTKLTAAYRKMRTADLDKEAAN
jgi:hypothetical protein